jgi:aminoglycoside phosphotransferase (APT) family kinase protein
VDLEGVLSGRGGDRAVRELLLGGGPRALRELIVPGGGRTLRACRLRRAHLKPGRKLSGYYDVYVRGESQPVAVAVAWYSGGVPAGAVELAASAEAGLRAAAVPARLERLWAADPARGMLVLATPLDPAFPGLGPLSDPARAGEALGSRSGELGGPAGAGAVRTIRYRPGQRHVLEYRRDGAPPLFVKLYRPGQGAPVAGAVTALADLLESAAIPRLHAVRPAAVLGDGDALVYRLAPGAPLSRALGAGRAPDAAHLAHVGLLLRTIHAAPRPGVPLPERDLGAEVRTVTRACEAMAALRPDLGALAAGIVETAHRSLMALEQEPLTPVHGDMKADHLLWGRQGLHVLDTDRCSLADPAYDLGKMLADLRFWGTTGGAIHAAEAEAAVLAAYAGTGARLDRARIYAALLLVRMAARRVPLASLDWAARTATLLASAGRTVR